MESSKNFSRFRPDPIFLPFIVHPDNLTKVIAEIARLEAACFERPWSPAQIRDWIQAPGNQAWFLTETDQLKAAGSASSRRSSYNTGAYLLVQDHPHESMTEILRIGVVPDGRRQGRGRRIIERFIEKILAESEKKTAGHWKIMLEVSETNTEGRALYRACEFQEIHRRRAYYPDGADALILELNLKL